MDDPLGVWPIARARPDGVAVIDSHGGRLTFAELAGWSNRLAHGLRSRGLKPGDGIALLVHNDPAFLALMLAAEQIGLYYTPINTHLTGPEIAYILSDSGARVFVASDRFADAARRAAEEAGLPAAGRFAVGEIDGFQPIAELTDGQPSTPPPDRQCGLPMFYTSGTTGRPKGVRRPLFPVQPEVAAKLIVGMLGKLYGLEPNSGVQLTTGPLYHTAPCAFTHRALHAGQTVVLMDKWDAAETLRLIQEHRITETHMVPTMFHRLLALPEGTRTSYDCSSLTHVLHAAAPCPVDVKRRMLEWWGPVIHEYYAATEGGGTYVSPQEWLQRPGTVGRPWPGSRIEIRDDEGKPLPPGEVGTIYIESGLAPAFEYHGDPAKTKAAYADKMFTVGDAGYLDEDGWLFIRDRKADMIISGGVNIYPAEAEAVLLGHPKVGDAAVIGVPDDDWGETVKAVIMPADGVVASAELAEELIAYCRDQLAAYKCPRTVDFRAELPRTMAGKLYKRLIRDEYWQGTERRV